MRKFLFILCFTLPIGGFTESITLYNNSSYRLYAEIYNAVGDKESTVRLQPNQTFIWYSDESPFIKQYDTPYTPYTVRWVCADTRPYDYSPPPKAVKGKPKPERQRYSSDFASWEAVPPGATVTALGSPGGTKTCVVKKRPEKTRKMKPSSPQKIPYSSQGFNNWSNDGGQTWTNDGGNPWDEDQGLGEYGDAQGAQP